MLKSSYFFYAFGALVSLTAVFATVYVPINNVFRFSIGFTFYEIINAVKVIYLLDLILSLLTKGRSSYCEGKQGLKQYIRRWLLVDVVAIIPWAALYPSPIMQLPLLLKLIKVGYYGKLIHKYLIGKNKDRFTLISLLFWTIIVAHLIACIWMLLGQVIPTKSNVENYVRALYWAVTTITTIGYGDITPQTTEQMVFAMMVQITGVAIFGFLIGRIASIFSKKDPAETEYLASLEKLDVLHRRKPFPEKLYRRITAYFTYKLEKRLGSDETEFIRELPAGLQSEVSMHLKSDLLKKIPLFARAGADFVTQISLALKVRIVMPDEYIFKAGEEGNEMYFISSGEVAVYSPKGDYLATLSEGNFFGEIALIKHQPRNATIRAITFCDLYRLDKEDFNRIVLRFPEVAAEIQQKADLRS